MQTLAESPVALIEQGAPHRIRTDAQLGQYTHALFCLTAKDRPTSAEAETIDLLTLLAEDYESKFRLPDADPISVLKYLMEVGGLQQQDLRPELWTTSNISMILSGQRGLTLANASALATRFSVDIRVFLPKMVSKSPRAREATTRRAKVSPATVGKRRVRSKTRVTTASR